MYATFKLWAKTRINAFNELSEYKRRQYLLALVVGLLSIVSLQIGWMCGGLQQRLADVREQSSTVGEMYDELREITTEVIRLTAVNATLKEALADSYAANAQAAVSASSSRQETAAERSAEK